MPDTASAETAYLFTHALLQRAAYELMLPSDRAALHGHALELLESTAAPAELAQHAFHAQHGAQDDQLERLKDARRKHLLAAARAAVGQYRHSECVDHFRVFLDGAEPSAAQRVEAGCELADVLYRSGKPAEAIASAQAALDAAQESGDALLRARAQLACGTCRIDTTEHARAEAIIAPAVEALKQLGDTTYLPRALARLSSAIWLAGRPVDALPIAEEAAQRALAAKDDSVWLSAHLNTINMQIHLGRRDLAMQRAKEIEPRLEIESDFSRKCLLCTTLGIVYDTSGDLERAEHYYLQGCQAARAAGLLAEVARALTNLGGVHHSRHQFSQALACQVEAEQIAREIGDRRILWYAIRGQGSTFDDAQDFQSGVERNLTAARIAESAGLPEQAHEARVWAACDYLNLHQPDEAIEILATAMAYQPMSAAAARYGAMGCTVFACALARLGRTPEAQEALARAEVHAKAAGLSERGERVHWLHNARVDVAAALGQ